MEIDLKKTTLEMLEAIKAVIGDNIKDVKDLVEDELEDFARRSLKLTEKVALGILTAEQAKAILRIRKNAVETVLLSISGIGILAAQEAINAAIGVLRKVLNSAIPGIDIL